MHWPQALDFWQFETKLEIKNDKSESAKNNRLSKRQEFFFSVSCSFNVFEPCGSFKPSAVNAKKNF